MKQKHKKQDIQAVLTARKRRIISAIKTQTTRIQESLSYMNTHPIYTVWNILDPTPDYVYRPMSSTAIWKFIKKDILLPVIMPLAWRRIKKWWHSRHHT